MTSLIDQSFLPLFIKSFVNVPEAEKALLFVQKNNPQLFLDLFNQYLDLVNDLLSLSDEDLSKIATIHDNFTKLVTAGGIEEPGAHTFIQKIGSDRLHFIAEATALMTDQGSPLFQHGLADLTMMMANASRLKSEGKDFVDGDIKSDEVIWTHTKISDPISTTHVILAHFFERCVLRHLREAAHIDFTKDYFLNVLDDVIILEEIRRPGHAVIFSAWDKPKELGGLSWINPEKVRAYRRMFVLA